MTDPKPPTTHPGSPALWKRTLQAGALAGGLSMLVLAVAGRREHHASAAALNAPSHWIHGDEALRANDWSLRHTGTGVAIHQASAGLWGGLMLALFPKAVVERPVATAVLTTATAAFVDLALTPPRLTPGFERRLSPRSLAFTYGAFALGLALVARRHAKASVDRGG